MNEWNCLIFCQIDVNEGENTKEPLEFWVKWNTCYVKGGTKLICCSSDHFLFYLRKTKTKNKNNGQVFKQTPPNKSYIQYMNKWKPKCNLLKIQINKWKKKT